MFKESVQVNNINSSLTKESKIIDNKNSKISNIQIIPNNNNNEQCINKRYIQLIIKIPRLILVKL